MKKINKFLSLITLTVFLIAILAVTSVSADNLTIVLPTNSSTLSGSAVYNITTVDAGDYFVDLANCTVYLKSANTGNSTYTEGETDVNSSSDSVNGTIDTTVFEDGTSYYLNVTCFNVTTSIASAEASGLIIDNTVPTQPSSTYPTGAVNNRTFVFGATVVNSTLTSCTLYFEGINPGSSSYTMDSTGEVCTYSATLVPEQTYRWYVRATDGLNTTDSSIVTANVDVGTSTSKIPALLEEPGVRSTGGATLSFADGFINGTVLGIPIWAIVLVIIVSGIVWYVIHTR